MELTPDNLELASKAAYERNFRNGAWDIQPTQCEKNDWRDAVEAAEATIPEHRALTPELSMVREYQSAAPQLCHCYVDGPPHTHGPLPESAVDKCGVCGGDHADFMVHGASLPKRNPESAPQDDADVVGAARIEY